MGGEYFPGKGNTKKAPPYSSNHSLFGASKVVLVVKDLPVSAGDPGSIPGLGSSPGEGIAYPPPYSWASLLVNESVNAAMQETWVRSLGWEYPLEKGTAIRSSTLAWRIPTDRSLGDNNP